MEQQHLTRHVRRVLAGLGVLGALWMAGCGQASYTEEERLERARDFLESGEVRAGIIEYRNLLQENPDHLDARWELGRAHLERGEPRAALAEFEKARSLGWDDPEGVIYMARAQLMLGEPRQARAMLEAREAGEFEDPQAFHLLLARAHVGVNDLESATAELDAALALDPDDASALTTLAQVHALRGELDRAKARLAEALAVDSGHAPAWSLSGDLHRSEGDLEAAEAAYTRVTETAPNPYTGHFRRALARMSQQSWDGVREDLEALGQLGPDRPATAYVRGVVSFHEQDYEAAVSALDRTLAGNPGYLPARFFLGASHFALGNLQQADAHLSRYVRSNPQSAAANRLLAAVRMQGGQAEEAEALLRRVLAENEADRLALELMAGVHASQGDIQSSIQLLRRRVEVDPDSVQARMNLARALLQGEDPAAGLRELEALSGMAPELEDLEWAGVLRLLQEGQHEQALSRADRIIEKHPDSPVAQNLRAGALLALGRTDEAVAALEEALRLDPGNTTATRNLAVLKLRTQGADSARMVLESGLEAAPEDPRLLMFMAEFEVEQGEPAEAGQYLQRAVEAAPQALEPRIVLARYRLLAGEPAKALEVLEGAPEGSEDNVPLLEVRAMAQLAEGQVDQGITTLRRLAELRPDSPEVHFRLGRAQVQAERPREARSALERALELDGEHPGALLALARLERREGREDKALELARRMQELEGVRAQGHLVEGDILATREDYAEAVQAYEASYRERVTSESAMKRFEALRRMGEETAAREWMRKHLANHPEDHRSRLVLATSLLEAGDVAAAKKDYEILVERFPEDAMVLNNLAYIYQREGDARSLEMAERAHRLQPEDPQIKDTLGMALLDHGDAERGLGLIREARETLPDTAVMDYHYAQALERNGQRDEAVSVLRELLAGAEDFPQRQQAQAMLERLGS